MRNETEFGHHKFIPRAGNILEVISSNRYRVVLDDGSVHTVVGPMLRKFNMEIVFNEDQEKINIRDIQEDKDFSDYLDINASPNPENIEGTRFVNYRWKR